MTLLHFPHIPTISIILPTYNRAEYLDTCLNSVLAQDFTDWELIVIDDGSQDKTFQIVDPLLQKDPRIRYLKHQNRKQGFSRNAGIQASFGKYITFIDSDDHYLPHHLSSRVELMKVNPELDLISGGLEVQGDIWVRDYYDAEKTISIYDCVAGGTFFGKREIFFQLRGFRPVEYGEDTDFWERAEADFNVAQITAPQTYIYVRTENSITGDAMMESS